MADTLPTDNWTCTQVTLVLSDDCFDEEAGGCSLKTR